MRVRLEDVARKAGVSPKTVSRVLNDEANVTDATRERVRAAMEAMDYRPNPSARSLAGNRSFLVAMLYDNNDNPASTYLAEIQDGVLEACDAHRYSMMVRPLRMRDSDFIRRLDVLISDHHPDGVVLTPPITDYAPLLKRLRECNVPYASVSPVRRGKALGVTMDEQRAARAIVEHLVELGHRRIAHVIGIANHGASRWRLEGYREAMAAAGLAEDPALVVQGAFTFASGVEAARQLFSLRKRPTAVFAANDDMATGVMWAAGEFGLKVPHDVSVCGFDDTPLSRQLWPALTTIQQPSREMGKIAAEQLLSELRSHGTGKLVQIPFSLQVRGSTTTAP
ncbi:LacI family DNA-binding transcriptional regulator [Luteibacter aegosomatissinici]|uniref:LacI family DNA-binding transcriptional regulator n=1 Tax=Luteibacter aegosomatissinici TaxID=2911539 RepID=UPI001FF81EC3|nr:LacI family DNA-binding transcriptional regulator [Luteibacter aegosomatissinici]UPG96604.1 LacI family DNA-binding transcriptional regulator [Luteibacter aegosomatissinici]